MTLLDEIEQDPIIIEINNNIIEEFMQKLSAQIADDFKQVN